ncbi:hypothetical protein OAE05_01865 [Gammaproteobacteria bacterium]|nr:hypothetical protein [Gammaproteobacteria bacterium]
MIIGELVKVFNKADIKIHNFNFKNDNPKLFWEFIKNQTFKGVYIFKDLSKDGIKQIIYVGKAGKFIKSDRTITNRVEKKDGYFFLPNELKNFPFNDEMNFQFNKFNSKIEYTKEERSLKKNFSMTTIEIKTDETLSPSMVESYILNKLLKEFDHFPKFNHKI